MDLEANDEQLDFPILYGIARQGIVVYDPDDVKGISVEEGDAKIKKSAKGMQGLDITPLFDTIIKHTQPYPDRNAEPLQLQIPRLWDTMITSGRLGIGRITKGVIKAGRHCGGSQGRRSDRTEEDQSGIRIQRTRSGWLWTRRKQETLS